MKRGRLAVVLLILALAEPAGGLGQDPAPPADDLLNATLWTERAIEHDLVYREAYRNATEKLTAAIGDPAWNALPPDERQDAGPELPPAVILDIDETVLDNSPYEARLVRSGKEFDEYSWKQWCNEASAKPLAGAVEFTTFAAAHGVAVYYITNRSTDLNKATLATLRKDGFPVASDSVLLGLDTWIPGCEQSGSEKRCRRMLVGRTHRVLMQFGDQIDDFVTVQSPTPAGRGDSVTPYLDWIGERWWVLPNAMYGSWESAQFANYWAQPREQRRKAKIDSLRTE